jgi:hypothetical protein
MYIKQINKLQKSYQYSLNKEVKNLNLESKLEIKYNNI